MPEIKNKDYTYNSLEWEKHRYYQCVENQFGVYKCKQMCYLDEYIENSKLLFVNQKFPQFIDKYILKYDLLPTIVVKK
jgi:hypothetical protein